MIELNSNLYTILIDNDCIKIKEDDETTTINFSEIEKIKFSSKKFKIFLKNGKKYKVGITKKETEKIKEILEHKIIDAKKALEDCAFILVKFNDNIFYTFLNDFTLNTLKENVIRRIAQHFYPALFNEKINLEDFREFDFYVCNGKEKSLLCTDEDVFASVHFHSKKIIIEVHNNKE